MCRKVASAVVAVLVVTCFVARAEGSQTLDSLRTVHEQNILKIEAEYSANIEEISSRYSLFLDSLIAKLQKKGDLENVLVVKKEKERFEKQKTIPERALQGTHELITEAGMTYLRLRSKVELAKAKQVLAACAKYANHLESWKKKLTADGEFDEALKFKAEVDRVYSSSPYTAAQFVVAAVDRDDAGGTSGSKVTKDDGVSSKGLVMMWRAGGTAGTATPRSVRLVRNGDSRITGNGLELAGGRVLVEGANDDLLNACRKSNELGLEVVLEAGLARQEGPARIVSFSVDALRRNFSLCQEGENLVLRLRTTETGLNGTSPQITLARLVPEKTHHVVVSYRPGELVFCMDGRKIDVRQIGGDFRDWQDCQLLFGNEWKAERKWIGEVKYTAIFSRFIGESEAGQRFASWK